MSLQADGTEKAGAESDAGDAGDKFEDGSLKVQEKAQPDEDYFSKDAGKYLSMVQ